MGQAPLSDVILAEAAAAVRVAPLFQIKAWLRRRLHRGTGQLWEQVWQ